MNEIIIFTYSSRLSSLKQDINRILFFLKKVGLTPMDVSMVSSVLKNDLTLSISYAQSFPFYLLEILFHPNHLKKCFSKV